MDNISDINIEDELTKSYLDYAMSVIIGRALPDIRDGLKPAHRRILYVMKELGNDFNNNYKKSARIVGNVIGKYHPHGETAVYDSIVRLAQPFTQRYTLIDGQGNFGSVDGDSPAAMRYTEIRMSEIASYLLTDLDYKTVDYVSNYDNTEMQPSVLPAMIPNLLINGSSGIAVGMATNIPPHNITEVINGCLAFIDKPDISINELMTYILGPDFPTHAIINGTDNISKAYKTGKGKITIRANISLKLNEHTGGKNIIVTELPYQVNKARLVERIVLLIKEKKIFGIRTLRDESDKDGLRIFIEVQKDKDHNFILNTLYSLTSLESVFNINMVALVNNKPKLLNLKDMLSYFIDHRREIVYRRVVFKLEKARNKAHILEGLCITVFNIDLIINLIKNTDSISILKGKLLDKYWDKNQIINLLSRDNLDICKSPNNILYGFSSSGYRLSDIQVQSILNLKLYKLTKLERDTLINEYNTISNDIKYYLDVLKNNNVLMDIIKKELTFIKNKFGDNRKTKIRFNKTDIVESSLTSKEDIIITLSNDGYIKSQLLKNFQPQHRGGKGKVGTLVKNSDSICELLITNTHSTLLCFSNCGKVYWIDLCKFPIYNRNSKGIFITNLLNLKKLEKINAILPVEVYEKHVFVFMVTKSGVVKKVSLFDFKNKRSNGIIAIDLSNDDILVDVKIVKDDDQVMLISDSCKVIRFLSNCVKVTSRMSKGVIGMRLKRDENIISSIVFKEKGYILTATENGFGKKTSVDEYPLTSRGRKGIIAMKLDKKIGKIIKVEYVFEKDGLLLITNKGILVRIKVKEIPTIGRNTKGVVLMTLSNNEYLVSIKKI